MGGILAAVDLGIATGGVMPRGFRTEAGPRPEYAALYGAVEHASPDYPARTQANVEGSDATVVFASDPDGDGTRLTLDACAERGRPALVNPSPAEVRAFLNAHRVYVLNVAGNRESVAPGIQARVRRDLVLALRPLLDDAPRR